MNERDPKNNNKSLLLKKNREKLREKKCKITRVFFFSFKIPLQRKAHNGGGKLRHKRDLSSNKQTNKQQHKQREDGQKREENKTRENHGLLSLLLFAFGAFLFEGVKVVRWKKEEEQKKHQSSSVDKDFSGCIIIRAFKQHERGGRFRGRVFR